MCIYSSKLHFVRAAKVRACLATKFRVPQFRGPNLGTQNDGYPKRVDERKWPGMGDWLTTDFRVPSIEWDRKTFQENESIVLELPYQFDPQQGTTTPSGRYLVADSVLRADSEYPDSRSVFQVFPVTLEKVEPEPFVQYVLLRSERGFLTRHKGEWITGDEKKDAEIFRLDARWGDHVVLFSSKRKRRWHQCNTIQKKEAWKPISFVLKAHETRVQSKEQVDGASLMILRKVVPAEAETP